MSKTIQEYLDEGSALVEEARKALEPMTQPMDRREALAAPALRKLLGGYRGMWVVLDLDWTEVLASTSDAEECNRWAAEFSALGPVVVYRVPEDGEVAHGS